MHVSRVLIVVQSARRASPYASFVSPVTCPITRRAMTKSPTIHVRFPSEPAPGTKITASTARDAIEKLKSARKDVAALGASSSAYHDYALKLSESSASGAGSARDAIETLADDAVLVDGSTYVAHLVKEYALRALTPARKYVVGRFKGQRAPTFTSGENAPVEWQMRHSKSDVHGSMMTLSGGKKPRATYTGTRDGQSAQYYVLLQQGDASVVALPCEEWYTFSQNVQRRVFTLEEAEARMEAGKKAVGDTWGRMDRSAEAAGYSDDESDGDRGGQKDESSDDEDDTFKKKKTTKKSAIPGAVDSDDEEDKRKSKANKDEEGGEDWEHDAEWDDDEDEVAIPEGEDAPKEPGKIAGDSDNEEELGKEGLAVKKLLGKQEKLENGEFSDDDSDSDLEEDFDPDKEDIAVNVVGTLIEQSKKLEAEEKAEPSSMAATPSPMVKSASAASVGVKRSASAADIDTPAAKVARKAEPVVAKQTPIEATIVEVVRKNPDSTTVKVITKACRKKGLLNSTAGVEELKAAINTLLKVKKLRDGTQVLVLK